MVKNLIAIFTKKSFNMRIISGFLKGQKLIESKNSEELRPTTDRNREALFNILNSAKFLDKVDFTIQDSIILDLCCGTGAVGFEAISRGAKKAILIDKEKKHLEIAKKNSEKLKVENQVELILNDALKPLNLKDKIDLVFIDPPYGFKFEKIIRRLLESDSITKKTLIIIESNQEQNFEEDLILLDSRKYKNNWFGFFALKKQA